MSVRNKARKCCVPNCEDKVSPRHRFPKNYQHVYQQWIENVNNPCLKTLTVEEIYAKYVVCGRHFLPECSVPGTRRGLMVDAVPTLFMRGNSNANLANESGCGMAKNAVSLDSGKCIISECIPHHTSVSAVKDSEDNNTDSGNTSVCKTPTTSLSTDDSEKENCVGFSNTLGCETPKTSRRAVNVSGNPPVCVLNYSTSSTPLPVTGDIAQDDLSVHTNTSTRKRSGSPFISSTVKKSRLAEVNVTRQADLTPKARHFYYKYCDVDSRNKKMKKRMADYKKRLHQAEIVATHPAFQKALTKQVNPVTAKFIRTQLRIQKLLPRGRRFTLQEKIFALSIYKVSPKGYRYLAKIFALPSKTTLCEVLARLPFSAGVQDSVFNMLKSGVENMSKREKCCMVLMDEMSITPNLHYDKKNDTIIGFEDYGTRSAKICDHVNTFMIKGATKQWKQPAALTFSQGPAKSCLLSKSLKEVIEKSQDIGLNVVATVCDQGTANEAAIKNLQKETLRKCNKNNTENRLFGFEVNGAEIIPLFDSPHLWKGLRNNLLTKDLHFVLEDGKPQMAKWEDIQDFYYLDTSHNTRICPKLTDSHVIPDKINKMKVSLCTQTFSHTVGALMQRISLWGIEGGLKDSAVQTSELILFVDKLIDSMNGNCTKADPGKKYRIAVSANSPHVEFWNTAIRYIRKWRFYCPKRKSLVMVPTLKNLVHTLRGFVYLKEVLQSQGVRYFLPRNFNQDALENFFGQIRSQGDRNVAPDAEHFIASAKTLIVNNFFSKHSPRANCEPDQSVGALNTFSSFLSTSSSNTADVEPAPCDLKELNLPKEVLFPKRGKAEECTITYVAGYAAKRMKSFTDCCKVCKGNVFFRRTRKDLDFVEARQYEGCKLTEPGDFLSYFVGILLSKVFYILPRICHLVGVKKILVSILRGNTDFSPLKCSEHPDFTASLVNVVADCIIFHWCKEVNFILHGKGSKFVKFLETKPDSEQIDPIKLQAYKMFMSRKNKKGKY